MSSSSMKRIRMQSGSWYLGTPGMTVTSLASRPAGRAARRCRCPRAPPSTAGVSAGSAAVSAAESAVTVASCGVTWCWSASVRWSAASGESASAAAGSAVLALSVHRLGRHCLGDTVLAATVSAASGFVVGLSARSRRPRPSRRPRATSSESASHRRRCRRRTAGVVVTSRPRSWQPRPCARLGCGRVGGRRARAGSATGWFSRSNQLGDAPTGRLSCPIRARERRGPERRRTAVPWRMAWWGLLLGRPGRAALVAGRPRRLGRARLPVRGRVAPRASTPG